MARKQWVKTDTDRWLVIYLGLSVLWWITLLVSVLVAGSFDAAFFGLASLERSPDINTTAGTLTFVVSIALLIFFAPGIIFVGLCLIGVLIPLAIADTIIRLWWAVASTGFVGFVFSTAFFGGALYYFAYKHWTPIVDAFMRAYLVIIDLWEIAMGKKTSKEIKQEIVYQNPGRLQETGDVPETTEASMGVFDLFKMRVRYSSGAKMYEARAQMLKQQADGRDQVIRAGEQDIEYQRIHGTLQRMPDEQEAEGMKLHSEKLRREKEQLQLQKEIDEIRHAKRKRRNLPEAERRIKWGERCDRGQKMELEALVAARGLQNVRYEKWPPESQEEYERRKAYWTNQRIQGPPKSWHPDDEQA